MTAQPVVDRSLWRDRTRSSASGDRHRRFWPVGLLLGLLYGLLLPFAPAALFAADVASADSEPPEEIAAVAVEEEEVPFFDFDLEGHSLFPPPSVASPSARARRTSGRMVDLRPPEPESIEDLILPLEPNWLDAVIDDHGLLWREQRDALEFLIRDRGGFGITSLGFGSDVQVGEGPVWVKGIFGWHFVSGPRRPHVRSQVYDLSLQINLAHQIDATWGIHLQLAPTWATDWANKSGDAFRLLGGGLVTFRADEQTKLVSGLMFLDRHDLPVMPIAGLRWTPRDDLEVDLLVPRPSVAWRISDEQESARWLYLAGEVGGGSWAIKREHDGRRDRMGYRDLRLLVGVESRTVDGGRGVLEAGYVFDRRLDFQRFRGDQRLGGTAVVRWGRAY